MTTWERRRFEIAAEQSAPAKALLEKYDELLRDYRILEEALLEHERLDDDD